MADTAKPGTADITSNAASPQPTSEVLEKLGLLAQLPGNWMGEGFNLLWRPNFAAGGKGKDFVLQLGLTRETMEFDAVGSPIPNRGFLQDDITLFGINYMHKVEDKITSAPLHLEPGLWLAIPRTTQPLLDTDTGVARLASIPHGTAFVAQGQAIKAPGGPKIEPANVTPFLVDGGAAVQFEELDISKPSESRGDLPPTTVISRFDLQTIIANPNAMLESALAKQNIKNTTTIQIATTADPIPLVNGAKLDIVHSAGGISNIPFLNSLVGKSANADVTTVFATFWIEEVADPSGAGTTLQLQYSQTVYLTFNGLIWPHVSVATLTKSQSK